MTTEQLTEQQLNAFGAKLEQFGDSLSPIEQRLLAEILSMAASSAAEQDVEGHLLAEVAPSLLAHAANMDAQMYLHTLALHFTHGVHAGAHFAHVASHAAHISTAADTVISGVRDAGTHTPK